MSSYTVCTCGRKRGDYTDLVVIARRSNHSAFNGYHFTPSNFSHIVCTRKGCCGNRRSDAPYVENLPDGVWSNEEHRWLPSK